MIISDVQWHSYKGNFTRDASTINHWNTFKIMHLNFHSHFPGANELRYMARLNSIIKTIQLSLLMNQTQITVLVFICDPLKPILILLRQLYLPNLQMTWSKPHMILTHWGLITHFSFSRLSYHELMACHLVGRKPLPAPMLTYHQLDPWEQTSV